LIAFTPGDDVISHASENCPDLFKVNQIIGGDVRETFGSAINHALKNVQNLPSIRKRRECLGRRRIIDSELDVYAFKSNEHVVVEFETNEENKIPTAHETLKDVLLISDRMAEAGTIFESLKVCAALLRTISGYDHVSVYRLDRGGPELLTEAGPSMSMRAFSDHMGGLHSIADVDGEDVRIMSKSALQTLDLSLSGLASPSPALREAVVSASASASCFARIEVSSFDWGRFVFLHRVPRIMSHRTRLALAHLQPVLSRRIRAVH
jgi:light-regulated signal transduction histidine kinase (bacteriophytochrome)